VFRKGPGANVFGRAGTLARPEKSTRPERKDWVQRLGAASGVVSTLAAAVIAGTGVYFTKEYNERQASQQELAKERDYRIAQVELIQKLMPHLNGGEREKKVALIALHLLKDSELAVALAELDDSSGSREALKAIKEHGSDAVSKLASDALDRLKAIRDNVSEHLELVNAAVANKDPSTSESAFAALKMAVQEFKTVSAESETENRGEGVYKYLAAVGLPQTAGGPGLPWNAAFVSWCFSAVPGGSPFSPSPGVIRIKQQFADRDGFTK
jgi:hypothetical protein